MPVSPCEFPQCGLSVIGIRGSTMNEAISKLIDGLSSETRALLVRNLTFEQDSIAVIGIGCRFPGASDGPEAFWKMLRGAVDAISEVPPDRWEVDEFFDPTPQTPGKM